MATPQTNEQELDRAESILREVLKDVQKNKRQYKTQDYRNLESALSALNKVTLRKDL